MEKQWIQKPIPKKQAVQNLAAALNIDEILATILIQRNIKTFEEARTFFRPSIEQLHDPFMMKGMHQAVERLEKAFTDKEKVLIYGDYDVDGTTSIALVYGFLQGYHAHLDFYVPDRYKEGYGISKQSIEWAKENGFTLVIALDCGIKSNELMDYAQTLQIDFIICDHHLVGSSVPNAVAVLDPKQADCPYPFKELTGCGIGFKFLQGFCIKNHIDLDRLFAFLDLVVLSIASDIVPIVGENRILAYCGLQKLNDTPRIGLKALMDISGYSNESILDISNLVFTIGPRINAVGRLWHAKKAIDLLISHDKKEADDFAFAINQMNSQRQDVDAQATQEAMEMIELENQHTTIPKSTVLFKADWQKGILGIVAARCIEKYHRPTIILTEYEGKITGSGRSIAGFNLHEAIAQCADVLLQYGGHHQAAGLTLAPENLEKFKEKFEKTVAQTITEKQSKPVIEIDLAIGLHQITSKFYRILKQMAPFGPENMRPVFVTENLIPENIQVLKEKHLRFRVRPQNSETIVFAVIAFGFGYLAEEIKQQSLITLAYTLEENTFQGKTSLQLRAKDIRF